jgi:hypothetical protein
MEVKRNPCPCPDQQSKKI